MQPVLKGCSVCAPETSIILDCRRRVNIQYMGTIGHHDNLSHVQIWGKSEFRDLNWWRISVTVTQLPTLIGLFLCLGEVNSCVGDFRHPLRISKSSWTLDIHHNVYLYWQRCDWVNTFSVGGDLCELLDILAKITRGLGHCSLAMGWEDLRKHNSHTYIELQMWTATRFWKQCHGFA